MPGLISKIFLANPDDDGGYSGVHLWETRQDAKCYLADGLARVLVDDRRFADVQARVMAVLPAVERMSCRPMTFGRRESQHCRSPSKRGSRA